MKRPIDIATRATAAFLAEHLSSGSSILEIGCGRGEVTLELQRRGLKARGLDGDPEAVQYAQDMGARVVLGNWPEFETPEVDAIAFTRSLHHIDPLREAVRKAADVLAPNGLLLLEDFAVDGAEEATLNWFAGIARSEQGKTLIDPTAHEFVVSLLGSEPPWTEWVRSHDHDLHTFEDMAGVIAERFEIRQTTFVPYFFRYLIPAIPDTQEAASFVEAVFEQEAALGRKGSIKLIGRRLVAALRPDSAD